MLDVNDLYEALIDEELFTEEELRLITDINGYNVDTLNDCIYARYGYRTYEQMKGEDEDDDE